MKSALLIIVAIFLVASMMAGGFGSLIKEEEQSSIPGQSNPIKLVANGLNGALNNLQIQKLTVGSSNPAPSNSSSPNQGGSPSPGTNTSSPSPQPSASVPALVSPSPAASVNHFSTPPVIPYCTSNPDYSTCPGNCPAGGSRTCVLRGPGNCTPVSQPVSCQYSPPPTSCNPSLYNQCPVLTAGCTCTATRVNCGGGRCVSAIPGPCNGHFDQLCSLCAGSTSGYYCLAKPVVYLYPKSKITIDVSVETTGEIVVSDPLYPLGGWKNVIAHPDGTLYYQGRNYRELFYETNVQDFDKPQNGLIIPTSELDKKLKEYITKLGLTRLDEQTEFLEFWIPKLKKLNAPYILFSILDNGAKDKADKVNISPQPETFIEFIAYFKPLEAPIDVESLKLPLEPTKRIGFTAVEWGGVIDDK